MSGGEWIARCAKPEPRIGARVERHPAIASADPSARPASLREPRASHALGQPFRLDLLPYLLVLDGELPVGAVPIALLGEDLLLLGLADQPDLGQPGLCTALLREALAIGREIGRRRILAPLTNADALALFYLQAEGFALQAVNPYEGPERFGIGGVAATHELVLEYRIA